MSIKQIIEGFHTAFSFQPYRLQDPMSIKQIIEGSLKGSLSKITLRKSAGLIPAISSLTLVYPSILLFQRIIPADVRGPVFF